MKLHPLNYTGQAIQTLRLMRSACLRHGSSVDAKTCEWLIGEIEKAVHFVVPLDGRIFDDGLRGIKGAEIRLPFPSITIEYESSANFVPTTEVKIVASSKRFIFAKELSPQELIALLHTVGSPWNNYLVDVKPPYDKGVIFVASIYSQDDREMSPLRWIPCGGAWLLPRVGWDDVESGKMMEPLQRPAKRERTRILCGKPVALLSDIFGMLLEQEPYVKQAAELAGEARKLAVAGQKAEALELQGQASRLVQRGVEMALRHVGNDMGPEAGTVLELIEALTCSNVGTATVQSVKSAVNVRRIRDGKMPLYETKVLTIDASPAASSAAHHGLLANDRRSPRQHLRRGHIRELQSGKRVWVQAHSVGIKGAISKVYKVKV